jgi:hypothetical protein
LFRIERGQIVSRDEMTQIVSLGLTDPEDPSSIRVAKIIVGLAKDGERDPARLRDLALKFVRPG